MLPSSATRIIVNRNVVVKNCIWKQCESIAWEFQCMRLFVIAGMPKHELFKLCPLHLEGQTQKRCVLTHTLKVATLTSFKNDVFKNVKWEMCVCVSIILFYFFIVHKTKTAFFGFLASFAYLNPFQQWLFDFEFHLFTLMKTEGLIQLSQKFQMFTDDQEGNTLHKEAGGGITSRYWRSV